MKKEYRDWNNVSPDAFRRVVNSLNQDEHFELRAQISKGRITELVYGDDENNLIVARTRLTEAGWTVNDLSSSPKPVPVVEDEIV